MITVQEILSAVAQLDPDEFVLLRAEMDRLETRLWEDEWTNATAEMKEADLTDEEIDRIVLRRRYEGRS